MDTQVSLTDTMQPDNTSTVAPGNDAFYTQLAHSWWDKNGPFWPIHKLNAVRVDYLRDWICQHYSRQRHCNNPLQGLRVLDIGCGGGVLSESMAVLGAQVTAIDVVERNIHVARAHALQQAFNIDYRINSAEDMLVSGQTYDVVLNMEVVEHVDQLPTFMHSCCRLLKPGGLTFIATINRTISAWLSAIIAAEYVLRWLPKHTHQWQKFRKPQELIALLQGQGLQVYDLSGVLVNPFNRKMRLSNATHINYMLVAGRESGDPALESNQKEL